MYGKKWRFGNVNIVVSTVAAVLAAIAILPVMGQRASAANELTVGTGEDYTTLAAAALDAVDGDTIILTEDVTEDVTFTTGELRIKSDDAGTPRTIYGSLTFDNDADLTLEDLNIEAAAGAGIMLNGTGTSTLTVLGACDLVTREDGIHAANNMELTLDDYAALTVASSDGAGITTQHVAGGSEGNLAVTLGTGAALGIDSLGKGIFANDGDVTIDIGARATLDIDSVNTGICAGYSDNAVSPAVQYGGDVYITVGARAALSIETSGSYAYGISSNQGAVRLETEEQADVDIHTAGQYSNGIFTTQYGDAAGSVNIALGAISNLNIVVENDNTHAVYSWHGLSIALDDDAQAEFTANGSANCSAVSAKYNSGTADITLGQNAKLSAYVDGAGATATSPCNAIYSESDMTIALSAGAQLDASISGPYSYGVHSSVGDVEISMEDHTVLDVQADGNGNYGVSGSTITLSGTPSFLYTLGGAQAMNVAPDVSALEGKQHGGHTTPVFAVVCTPQLVDGSQPPITTATDPVSLDLSALLCYAYPYDHLTFPLVYSTDNGLTWTDTGISVDGTADTCSVDVAGLLTAAGTYQFSLTQMATYGGEDYDSYEAAVTLTVLDAYTVTYDANGGTGSSYAVPGIADGGSHTVLSDGDVGFTADGDYYFSGWQDADGIPYSAGDTITVDEDITLYAQWTANGSTPEPVTYYQVTYHENGADAGTVPQDTNRYLAGDTVTTRYNTGALRRSGYYFTGWSLDAGGGTVLRPGAQFVIGDADIDLYAVWQVTTGSSKATGGSSSSASSDLESLYDEEVPLTSLTTEHIRYIQGYPDNSVQPDGNLTRAEAAAIFYRLIDDSGKTQSAYTASLLDVGTADWYYHEIAYLTNRGVMFGYADDTFRGDEAITRAEFAALASRFSALVLVDENNFSDVSDEHWAAAYINSAVASGWISGYADGTFHPDQSITRAEAVTLVNHVTDRALLAGNAPEDLNSYSDLSASHWAYCDIMEASHTHTYEYNDAGEEIWTEFS